MERPSNLVVGYFGDIPDNAGTIADVPTLSQAGLLFLGLLLKLKIIRVTDKERVDLSGKGFFGQRPLSQSYQRFLVLRPDFAAAANVDPAVYQKIIDKDESFDVLVQTLSQLAAISSNGMTLLSGINSVDVKSVLDYLVAALADKTRPAQEVRVLRVAFNAVVRFMQEQTNQVKGRQQTVKAQKAPKVKSLAAVKAQKATQVQAGGLEKVVDTNFNPVAETSPPAPSRKLGGKKLKLKG